MISNLESGLNNYMLNAPRINSMIAQYHATGYGYANYPTSPDYGVAVAQVSWIKNAFERAGHWRHWQHMNAAWDNHHDIYCAVKA